jgi:murein DD-endopeptidase MepM/ murein hydrolase activator NlpD
MLTIRPALERLEPRLHLARPDPSPAENVYFRLPLSSDTTTHFYFDRNEASGAAVAWNGTQQTYDGHRGTDFSGGPRGRPVYAAAPGVLIAKDDGHPDMGGPPNGNYVRINHGNNRDGLPINSVYLHFNAGSVTAKSIGSFIAAGEQVGGVGTSGNSTGLHLHFETQLNRVAFDPYRATGSNEISWWTNQGTGSPSTQAQPDKLDVGDAAQAYELTTSSLNVRAPNPTSPTVGQRVNGDVGTVLEGPAWAAFNNDFNNSLWVFYKIRWSDGMEGWSVQNWLREQPDTVPPVVLQSDFVYQTAPHRLKFRFSENVGASLQPTDLVVRDAATQAQVLVTSVAFDATTNTATFTLNNTVPDGRYRATLAAASVTDAAGNPLAADHVHDFFFLTGDANHDARVNLLDFNTLAGNFGQTGLDFTQGDFDYDGTVNLQDFNLLASRFGIAVAVETSAFARHTSATDESDLFDLLRPTVRA